MNWTEATPINTTNLNDLETRITNAATSVTNGKNTVAAAITAMGQAAAGSDSFATLATKIADISDDANAVVGEVVSGKTFYQGGTKKTGTMPDNGTVNITPGTTNQTIAAGKHTGSGVVYGDADLVAGNIKTGVDLFGTDGNFTADADAIAAEIKAGKTAYVNGVKLIGTYDAKKYASGDGIVSDTSGNFTITGLSFTPSFIMWHLYNASTSKRALGGAAFKTPYSMYGDSSPTGMGAAGYQTGASTYGQKILTSSNVTWNSDGAVISGGLASCYIKWYAFE